MKRGRAKVKVKKTPPMRSSPKSPKRVSLKDCYAKLTESEKDQLADLAFKHYFEVEQDSQWIPLVEKSVLLLEGVNVLTKRQCRIYVSPGRRVRMVETLS